MSYTTIYEQACSKEKQLLKKLSVIESQLKVVQKVKDDVHPVHKIEVEAREKLWEISGGKRGRKPNYIVRKECQARKKLK